MNTSFLLIIFLIFKIKTQLVHKPYEENKFTQAINFLSEICQKHKDKCYQYSIGKSILGNDLIVLSISEKYPDVHLSLRPEVKYVGCIHGNEFVTQYVLLRLVDYLLTQNSDPNVKYILKNMRVHILPIINPDGFIKSSPSDYSSLLGRSNHAGYDLNRNFPDLFKNNTSITQPETMAILDWLERNTFVLSASINAGSLVAVYPFDNYHYSDFYGNKTSKTQDNDVFMNLAKTYSFNHPFMWNISFSRKFIDGITNGAEWYPISGGMQDVNYWKYGCMEITLEISYKKYPNESSLLRLWHENKVPLLEYLKKANTGVKGIVTFENGIPVENATIMIDFREPYFKTNPNGEYYRILLPGTYNLRIAFGCLSIYQTKFTISNGLEPLILNITISQNYSKIFTSSILDRYSIFCSSKIEKTTNDNTNSSYYLKLNYFLFKLIIIFNYSFKL